MTWTLALMVALAVEVAPTDLYQSGLDSFNVGDFAASIQSYEELLSKGQDHPAIHYNLGNAYYREGHMGPAVVSYERALQLNPSMDLANDNLEQAINRTANKLARPPSTSSFRKVYFWHDSMSVKTVYAVALITWWMAWGLLIVRIVKPFRFQRRAVALLSMVALLFYGSYWVKSHPLSIAVAMGEKVPVRFGHTNTDTIHFELFTGDRVLIDDEIDGWYRVETATGDRGWARKEYLIPINPRRRALRSYTTSDSIEENPSGLL